MDTAHPKTTWTKRKSSSARKSPFAACFAPCIKADPNAKHDIIQPDHEIGTSAHETPATGATTTTATSTEPAPKSRGWVQYPHTEGQEVGKPDRPGPITPNESSLVKAKSPDEGTSNDPASALAQSTAVANKAESTPVPQAASNVYSAAAPRSSMATSDLGPSGMNPMDGLMPPPEIDPSLPKAQKGKPAASSVSRSIAPRNAGLEERSGTIRIRMDLFEQTMKGIGYSNAFYTNWWHTDHPNSGQIYYKIFHDLRPAILRIRNAYRQDGNSDRDMQIDQEFVQKAGMYLGYKPEVLLTAWSPPTEIKASGRLNAGTNDSKLAKDNEGRFKYYEFAQFWVESLRAYKARGIEPTYISVQNEPDYNPEGHPGALFAAKEAWHTPGYYRAADEVYDTVKRELGSVPQMIGPEGFAADSYLDDFPYGSGNFSAFASHLYASGDKYNPWTFNEALHRVRRVAQEKNVSEVYMTEYAKLGQHEYEDPLRLAIVLHNTLTIANCQMYLHWDGCWGANTTGNEGTLLLVDNPYGDRRKWSNELGYTVLHSFYWFQHFSLFIRPGYRRVVCEALVDDGGVLASAWSGPSGQFALIMINIDHRKKNITLLDLPNWVHWQSTQMYYSTLDIGFTHWGTWQRDNTNNRDYLELWPRSITTIYSSSTG